MTTNINLIIDAYTNLFYTHLNNINTILFINKFILNLYKFNNIKYINLKFYCNNKLLKQFDNLLTNTISLSTVYNFIKIIISRLKYPNKLEENRLIIRLGNFKNVIIYIPSLYKVKINISEKNTFIDLLSPDLNYMKNLAAAIKNIKKVDKCTGIGMYYEKENIMFKNKLKNDNKKK